MRDVARLAGVSPQTVSCVVNDIPVISAATRQRVLEAVAQLNYAPDPTARSLRSGRTRIIGLLIPDAHNPHFWQTVSGAEDEATAHGYSLLLATTAMSKEREQQAFQALLRQHLDGLIPLFTYPELFHAELLALQRKRFPVCLVTSDLPLGIECDRVWPHYEQTARNLTEHLIGHGHRRIGFIWGVGRSELGRDRVQAYRQALEEAGLDFEPRYLVQCGKSLAEGFQAAEQLLELRPRPTAIIGLNDLMAFGALQAAQRRGLRVPAEISIAGFDDLPMSGLLSPALTSGRIDSVEIGRLCVRLVLKRLENPGLAQQIVHLESRLVIRQSTGPCPAEETSTHV
jgi:LacI family transcriptional regulator